MSLAVAVELVGGEEPQAVQISITGSTSGDALQVTGNTTDDTWTVRGGDGVVSDGSLIVLVDVASPINVPVTYEVTDGDTTASAAPLTVPYAGTKVLTSIDGQISVAVARLMNNGAPRQRAFRQAIFPIPGSTAPAVRYDVPSGKSGQIVILTDEDQSANLDDLLDLGGFAILRTNGQIRDLPAVQFILVTGDASQLNGADNRRTWTLDFQVVADPEPDAIVAAVTWDDFDAAWSTQTWADFDTAWASGTWDQFDQFDWTTL